MVVDYHSMVAGGKTANGTHMCHAEGVPDDRIIAHEVLVLHSTESRQR
jgi:hypothetical protein